MKISAKSLAYLLAGGAAAGALAFVSAGAQTAATKVGTAAKTATVKTEPPKSTIDSTVIDPVARLAQISKQVKASSTELSAIATELDKLMAELDKMEGKPAKDIDRAHFARLEKRFNTALAQSEAVEKKVGQSLSGNLKDIATVRAVLKNVEAERRQNKNIKKVMSDAELKECLKDLSDLDATVRELLNNLKDSKK